ncbi:hypothetical protein N4G62_05165 [Sphingomonas sanguinis]|uniref:DUF4424 domain-containing protein n=1 Tax=Sphingomonas sanguinis TaxID=33051 RepID=A0ABU5LNB0_9SPHN|nr:hypothetical protein [Sphingomonas sanguinis]MDZ7281415.1 hypothetical protein [Sphingomonas sanguinis]
MRKCYWAAAAALLATTAASARDLPVPADKGWMHAQTRLIVRSTVAGLTRTAITDATTTEHDVAIKLESADKSVFATLFLFHPAVPSVPLWFDRSRTAIEERKNFDKGAPASADPIAFAPTGTGPEVALRQSWSLLSSPYRSTSLAVLPMGEWMLVVRLTAEKLTADTLDQKMNEIIAALRPAIAATAAYPGPAVPIRPCATQTDFAHLPKAKLDKSGQSNPLFTLLMSAAVSSQIEKDKSNPKAEPVKPVAPLCRDGVSATPFGVYRWENDDTDGYMMALYDAGRTIDIFPDLMSQVENRKTKSYTIRLNDVDGSASSYPSFTNMPRPEQVFDLIAKGTPTAKAQGKNITINSSTLGGS